MLEVRLLGQFQVRLDGKEIEISSQAAKGLLAYLVIYETKKHLRETLVELFWGDSSPDIGRKYLRNAISKLQDMLGTDRLTGAEFILTDRASVWINKNTEIITDVKSILNSIPSSPTIKVLSEEVSNYGGKFLPDFSEDWVLLVRAQLKAAFNRKIELLLQLLVNEKRWKEVIEWAERWIAIEKAPEAAFRAMMVAHASQDQEFLVIEDFRRCEETLLKESGIPPSELTSRTYRQLTLHKEFGKYHQEVPVKGEPGEWLSSPGSLPARAVNNEKHLTESTHIALNTLVNGRYRLDQELGDGFMGVVYQAYDTRLGRDVAIKMLKKEHLGVDGYFRLIQEAQTIAKINHPNIVTIYDAGEFDGTPFMVIELLQGETLTAQIPKQFDEVLRILYQICAALHVVHGYGIVHRDLKPENVMILPDGKIKLMDFGLAHYDTSRMTREGEILGSVYYLSPEQALGKPVDARTDIYALGVLAYELATGKLPFTGENMVAVLSQHLYSMPAPPSETNPQLDTSFDDMVLRMMAKLPDDRPASIIEVIENLKIFLKGDSTTLRVTSGILFPPGVEHSKQTGETSSTQLTKSGVHLLVESWRKQGQEILDPASLALVHGSPPETVFEFEDALLLTRSALHRQVELDPWLARCGSKENAACVLERLVEEYPKPDIRLKIVRGLESLNNELATATLLRIATSDDAPTVRSQAALAAVSLGKKDQVIAGLLENMRMENDVAAITAFVAVIDEYGLPKDTSGYPGLTVAVNLFQRRLKASGRLIVRQGVRSAFGAGIFLAANGLAAPFFIAISYPKEYQETLQFVTVPTWMIIGALGLLVIGALQGFASGLAVGFADAVWKGLSRRYFRLFLGGLSGLALCIYLVLFTRIGAINPITNPSVYIPTYFVYGLLMGTIITIVVPKLGEPRSLRSQLVKAFLAAFAAGLVTIPYVNLVYGSEATNFYLSRILLAVLLQFGIAVFLSSRENYS